MTRGSILGLLLVLLVSCRKPEPQSPPAHAVAGVLLSTAELGPPFLVQQRIHGKYEGREMSLDCVVQLDKGKLSVIGLTPFNSRAFLLEQEGTSVRLQKFIDREIPFDPTAVLYDIHRVFFRGLSKPRTDGDHRGMDHGDQVTERWREGHVVERRFQGLAGPTPQLVQIDFSGAPAPVVAPRVRLTNVAFGYSLLIETLEQQLLAGSYTLEVKSGADAPGSTLAPNAPKGEREQRE